LTEVLAHFKEKEPRGEIVIVLGGKEVSGKKKEESGRSKKERE
jgi:16S rRNA C1402 (ribose-2'-O) methylase RsmI